MDVATTPLRITPGRSCIACRGRKIRCNRQHPCAYCNRLRIECKYPTPDSDGQKSPNHDVAARLGRIEQSLKRIESSTTAPRTSSSAGQASQPVSSGPTPSGAIGKASSETERLVTEAGESRYEKLGFWTALDAAGTRDSTIPRTAELDPGAGLSFEGLGDGMLAFSSTHVPAQTSSLHPPDSGVFALWQAFLDGVDPVVKIIHVPTVQRELVSSCQNRDGIPAPFESLMFAIYFAAASSMRLSTTDAGRQNVQRRTELEDYRAGMERSLIKANCISKPSLFALQALTLYLICARQSSDKTYVWSMTGLLIRLAMKIGLHRDPGDLGTRPFIAELRRRLWWQICTLDVRTAEENDMDPFIHEQMHNTKFPANVNDSDLDANMTHAPSVLAARTDMTFSLIRVQVSHAARKLVFSSHFSAGNGYAVLSLQNMNDEIDNLLADLNERYLSHCDDHIPISYLARTATHMILVKFKLIINHPSRTHSEAPSQTQLHALVESSKDIIRYAHGLRSDETYSRWSWLFEKYIEWDAVAFLLHSMSVGVQSAMCADAWELINTFFEDWSGRLLVSDRRWTRLQSLRAQIVAKGNVAVPVSLSGTLTDITTDFDEHALHGEVRRSPSNEDVFPHDGVQASDMDGWWYEDAMAQSLGSGDCTVDWTMPIDYHSYERML